MADFARYLPLSNRHHDDERSVSRDRRGEIAAVIEEATRLLEMVPAHNRAQSGQNFITQCRLGRGVAPVDSSDLTSLADTVRNGKHRPLRTLAHTVHATLVLAQSVSVAPRIDVMTAGAAALYASGTAPLERRAVIAGHTIRATDGDWAFGNGPILEAPALDIAAFLLGTTDVAPHAPESGGAAAPTA